MGDYNTLESILMDCRPQKAQNRNNPYYKYELVDAIHSRIGDFVDSYSAVSLNLINKDELKRVYYGLVSLPEESKPYIGNLIDDLPDWGKVMFFAGVWYGRDNVLNNMDVHYADEKKAVIDLVKSGYDNTHRWHMKKFNLGKYKRPLKIPRSQLFRKKYLDKKSHERVDFKDFKEEFAYYLKRESEDPNIETYKTTARFLDNLRTEELKKLTQQYGADVLGHHAIY